ncbi:MAG: hypothetical protein LBG99_02180 [Propionibacteriaceae bacterium]|jgi:hypothetical protein|nr:hypothetical protein [Propionibacteriaceae bacterium]
MVQTPTVDLRCLEMDTTSLMGESSATANAASVTRCRDESRNLYVAKILKPQCLPGHKGPGTGDCIDWSNLETLMNDVVSPLVDSTHTKDALLLNSCSWPLAIIEDKGKRIGILLRWHESAGDWGDTTQGWPSFSRVTQGRVFAGRHHNPSYYPKYQKIARLGEVLLLVHDLHLRGVTIGDLRAPNLLTAPPDVHHVPGLRRVFMLDTDSFRFKGAAGFANVPPGEEITTVAGTRDGDSELLGRLIIYSLTESLMVTNVDEFTQAAGEVLPPDHIERIIVLASGHGRGIAGMVNIAQQWTGLEARNGDLYSLNTGTPVKIADPDDGGTRD